MATATVIGCFLCAVYCSKHFTDLNSFNLCNSPTEWVLVLSPFYSCWNKSTERLQNMPRAHSQCTAELGIWFWAFNPVYSQGNIYYMEKLESNLLRMILCSQSCRKNHKHEIRGCSCNGWWLRSQATWPASHQTSMSWSVHPRRRPGVLGSRHICILSSRDGSWPSRTLQFSSRSSMWYPVHVVSGPGRQPRAGVEARIALQEQGPRC